MRSRSYAVFLSLFFALVTLWPLTRSPHEDSFPLSTYPMFAHRKNVPELTLVQALGVNSTKASAVLPPSITAGNNEVISALVTIRRGVTGSRAKRSEYCGLVAKRVADAGAEFEDVTRIELVKSTFNTLDYFTSSRAPLRRKLLQSCEVP